MEELRCKVCGGDLVKRESETGADCEYICAYCKTIYRDDVVRKMIVDGIPTFDKLIENGNQFLDLGEYGLARDCFSKAANHSPGDYRGWWGMVNAQTGRFQKFDIGIDVNNREYQHALSVASPEDRVNMQAAFSAYMQKQYWMTQEQQRRMLEAQQRRQREEEQRHLQMERERIQKNKKAQTNSIINGLWIVLTILGFVFLIGLLSETATSVPFLFVIVSFILYRIRKKYFA